MNILLCAVIVIFLATIYIATWRKRTVSLPLPPGPPKLPIIGNLHQAPKSHGWRTYSEWSKLYGPLVHVNMLGQSIIILSSNSVAHDLLAKRGANFSDRPHLFLATELANRRLNILLMNYTEQFRHHQRLQALVLTPSRVAEYFPVQVFESKQLLHDLLLNAGNDGAHVHDYFQRTVASIIHTLLYGFRILENDDPVLTAVIQSNVEFSAFVQVGAHIVDTFPILNNLPGFLAPWKKEADIHFTTKQAARKANFHNALNKKEWNISKHLMDAVDKGKEDRDMPLDELAFEIGTIIDAALDGTTDSLIWFVVACVTQDNGFVARAQHELDEVVGRHRLPVPEDRPNLPYVTAVMEEIFRWRPVGPEGAPHFNKEETTYEGYTIPARSVIVANLWAIAREEAIFGADVESFKPERWLDVDASITRLKDLPLAAFGYGRRICPGRHFGRNVVWIIVAQLLWSFDITAGKSDVTGRAEQVDPLACTYGLVMRALPFKATFKPRGDWVTDLINKQCDTRSQGPDGMLGQIGAAFARR